MSTRRLVGDVAQRVMSMSRTTDRSVPVAAIAIRTFGRITSITTLPETRRGRVRQSESPVRSQSLPVRSHSLPPSSGASSQSLPPRSNYASTAAPPGSAVRMTWRPLLKRVADIFVVNASVVVEIDAWSRGETMT